MTEHELFSTEVTQVDGATVTEDPESPGVTRFGETSVPPFESDFGGYKHEDAGGYQYLLDYRVPVESMPRVRLADVIDGKLDQTGSLRGSAPTSTSVDTNEVAVSHSPSAPMPMRSCNSG